MLKYYYTYLYFKNKENQEESVAWFYTLSFVGFISSLIFISIVHIILIGIYVFIYKPTYMFFWLLPWASHLSIFYFINKDLKNKVLLNKKDIPKNFGWILFITLLFAITLCWITLVFYSLSSANTPPPIE